jgi:hypothetical protein
MSKRKIRVGIYEGDPFSGCCGPVMASPSSAENLRKMLIERNETVKTLKEEFKEQIEVEREIVSNRRRYDEYPQYILRLLRAGTKMPFILIDGQLVQEGAFPSYENFKSLVKKHIK